MYPAYLCEYDPHKKYSGNTYPTNIKRAKMVWVPKLNT